MGVLVSFTHICTLYYYNNIELLMDDFDLGRTLLNHEKKVNIKKLGGLLSPAEVGGTII
jgi:hypothetical protein